MKFIFINLIKVKIMSCNLATEEYSLFCYVDLMSWREWNGKMYEEKCQDETAIQG